jgi:hypothetical protein
MHRCQAPKSHAQVQPWHLVDVWHCDGSHLVVWLNQE